MNTGRSQPEGQDIDQDEEGEVDHETIDSMLPSLWSLWETNIYDNISRESTSRDETSFYSSLLREDLPTDKQETEMYGNFHRGEITTDAGIYDTLLRGEIPSDREGAGIYQTVNGEGANRDGASIDRDDIDWDEMDSLHRWGRRKETGTIITEDIDKAIDETGSIHREDREETISEIGDIHRKDREETVDETSNIRREDIDGDETYLYDNVELGALMDEEECHIDTEPTTDLLHDLGATATLCWGNSR